MSLLRRGSLRASVATQVLARGIAILASFRGTPTPTPTPTSLTAPTVAVTSAAGAPPEVNIGIASDEYAGFYLDIQRANNTSSDFTILTLDVSYQITDQDFFDGITNLELAAEGYADPSGPYSQRYRIRRDDGVSSAWVAITGTVTASVGVLTTAAGTGKSANIDTATYSGLGGRLTASPNGNTAARSTVAVTGKMHFELSIAALSAVATINGSFQVGVCDISAVFNGGAAPNVGAGSTNPAGCGVRITRGSTGTTVFRNGASAAGAALPSAPVVGDSVVVECDPATATASFWFHRASDNSDTLIAAVAMSSKIPTDYVAFAGGYNLDDQFSINFGGSAWVKAPTTGYQGW